MNFKNLIHMIDEEIKSIEYEITAITQLADECFETLRDGSISVIDNTIAKDKLIKAQDSKTKLTAKLNEALKIKHMIEENRD